MHHSPFQVRWGSPFDWGLGVFSYWCGKIEELFIQFLLKDKKKCLLVISSEYEREMRKKCISWSDKPKRLIYSLKRRKRKDFFNFLNQPPPPPKKGERLIFISQNKVTIEIQKLQINYTYKKTIYFEDHFGEQIDKQTFFYW